MGDSKYKVGDTVTIKDLGEEDGYHFGTNSEMRALRGKSFKIQRIEWAGLGLGAIPDDGYKYTLEGNRWNWASSMFEDSSTSLPSCISRSPNDTNIEAFVKRKKCPKLDFHL